MMDADQALETLQEGNRRFVAGAATGPHRDAARVQEVAAGQAPFAAVLACADSRVPPELIFDQGLGDLFVVRVAGNIPAPTALGSLEFAADAFGFPLVVVLGHARCGAIQAALSALREGGPAATSAVEGVLEGVRPAVAPWAHCGQDQAECIAGAVADNVRHGVGQLQESAVLARRSRENGLRIIGAEYDLDTGMVRFHNG